MAISVPRQVLERALRNQPPSEQKGPKFGTFAWRSQSYNASTAIMTPEPEPVWFLPRFFVPFAIKPASITVVSQSVIGAEPTISWTVSNLPATPSGQPIVDFSSKIAYDGVSNLVATTLYLEKAIYSNDNGSTWNYSDLISNGTAPGYILYDTIGYGDGKFIALGYDNVTNSSLTGCYSDDGGVSWNKITLPINAIWNDIAYGNGRYIVTARLSLSGIHSTDGINWTVFRQPLTGTPSVTFGGEVFTMIDNGLSAFYSTNGVSWSAAALPGNEPWATSRVCWTGDQYIAFGTNNSFRLSAAYSPDHVNWTYSLAFSSTTPFPTPPSFATNIGSNIIMNVGSPLRIPFTPNSGTLWYYVSGPFISEGSQTQSWGATSDKFIAFATSSNKFAIGELVY
jgi:hypothetical protein